MVLLVVDTQRGCFNESLYAFETVKENIRYAQVVSVKEAIEMMRRK